MQYRRGNHPSRHTFGYQCRSRITECLEGCRRRSRHTTAIGGILQGKIGSVVIDAITHRHTGRMNEPLLEVVNIQQHIDRVELNIDMKLIENGNRHVVFYAGLNIQSGPEGSQVARGQADITRSADFPTLYAKLFVVLSVEFVGEHAHVRKHWKRAIRDHADR